MLNIAILTSSVRGPRTLQQALNALIITFTGLAKSNSVLIS